ncbi:MAG TPA: hypothetical protein VGD58_07235, partial [Herpetosiphonaceae bacterium]
MGQYADQIATLELVLQLKKSAGRDNISQTEIDKLDGMVADAADTVGPLLKLIPQTFKQYTEHDIGHSRNILYLMGRFIPSATLEQLNGLELAILILSALLHDLGMFVSDEEKIATLQSREYSHFLAHHHDRVAAMNEARSKSDDYRADLIRDALLAEYFRRLHPERAALHVRTYLAGKLVFQGADITRQVLQVCESHGWGVLESNNPRDLDKAVARMKREELIGGVPINLQYLACCLRLGDIMDFDRSRTPLAVFQNIGFTETKSWEEWNKHLQVSGWKITEYEVLYATECSQPAFYVAVMEFLDWIDAELRECRHLLVKEARHDLADRYRLHLPPVVDRSRVEMADKRYLAGAFRFHLEYERIMQLLMDKSLYPDPSLFLRELLQNALDACRNREALAREKKQRASYKARIAVWDYSDDPDDPRIVFQDNGIGMSRRIVENYFMRVGRSYYRSAEFEAERQRLKQAGVELEATSQFGIGILSCFMVADRFEVETYRTGNQPLHITIEGPTKYFTIRLLDEPPRADFVSLPKTDQEDGPPNYPGTRITVHLRPDAQVDAYQVLDQFAVNVEYDLFVYRSGAKKPRKISRLRWEPKEIRLRDLKGAIGQYQHQDKDKWVIGEAYRSVAPKVTQNLADVLIASRIPFEKYEFSQHLRGSAWFWLLRSEDGGVCAQRGYLRIGTSANRDLNVLSCIGLPSVINRVISNISALDIAESNWMTLLEQLRANLSIDEQWSADPHNHEELIEAYRSISHGDYGLGFVDSWFELSFEERKTMCEFLEKFDSPETSWYNVPGVAKQLLLNSLEWSKRSLTLKPLYFSGPVPQSISLHGILLPAGFVKWEPMMGSARKMRLLTIPSGVQVDMRGITAPTPAASRLFIDLREAGKVVVPFARATLRHAVELAAQNPDKTWEDWLRTFIDSTKELYFWPEAIQQELELLEQHLQYEVYTNDTFEFMSRRQLLER